MALNVKNISACVLRKGTTVAQDVTCTSANTDYAADGPLSVGTRYVVIYCPSVCKVAMGAATSSTNGVYVGAGMPTIFPVYVTGVAADDTVHVQSQVAGAVVTITQMAD